MPDSTLSRRSAALHARLAKYPSGNHKIIPRIFICLRVGVTKGRGTLEKNHQTILPPKAIFLYSNAS